MTAKHYPGSTTCPLCVECVHCNRLVHKDKPTMHHGGCPEFPKRCNECGAPATRKEKTWVSGHDEVDGYWECRGVDNLWCDKHGKGRDTTPVDQEE